MTYLLFIPFCNLMMLPEEYIVSGMYFNQLNFILQNTVIKKTAQIRKEKHRTSTEKTDQLHLDG
jgi:hypothetical protein